MFLFYILKLDKNELMSKVFWAQYENPVKNDWWLTVKDDLKEFELNHLQLEEIAKLSKTKFKKTIKIACKRVALAFLLKEQESKSKVKHIQYSSLQLQNYLKSDTLFKRTKLFKFKLRTRMLNLGFNYGKKFSCKICKLGNDDQQHLLQCIKLKMKYPFITENINYNDIFNTNAEKQENAGNILEKLFRTRIEILEEMLEEI